MKQAILTAIGIVAIVVFFHLPKNRSWFTNRIVDYSSDFNFQRHELDPEVRRIERWGNSYLLSRQIAEHIGRQTTMGNALVLVPPSAYFKERNVDYRVPEPAVFYYYTGLKTTWVNSKLADKANWMVSAQNGQLRIIPVNDRNSFKDSLVVFRKYPVSL